MPRIGLLIAVIVVLVFPDTARAGRVEPYRWDESKVIIVENRAGPTWNQAVAFNFSNWNKLFPRLKFRVVNKPGKPCSKEDGKIIVCAVPQNPKWAGITSPYTDRREIVAVRIQLTARVFGNDEYWNQYRTMSDMLLLCHETVHALGLDHNSATTSSCVASGSQLIAPGQYDRNRLITLYKKKGAKWP